MSSRCPGGRTSHVESMTQASYTWRNTDMSSPLQSCAQREGEERKGWERRWKGGRGEEREGGNVEKEGRPL